MQILACVIALVVALVEADDYAGFHAETVKVSLLAVTGPDFSHSRWPGQYLPDSEPVLLLLSLCLPVLP